MFKADKVLNAANGDTDGRHKLRTDEMAVEIDGDYTETLARLKANLTGKGVFGMAFLENNKDKLKAATVQSVVPAHESIASGTCKASRPLFPYAKADHPGIISGLAEVVNFFVSDDIAGKAGSWESCGLVPGPKLKATQSAVAANNTMGSGGPKTI